MCKLCTLFITSKHKYKLKKELAKYLDYKVDTGRRKYRLKHWRPTWRKPYQTLEKERHFTFMLTDYTGHVLLHR